MVAAIAAAAAANMILGVSDVWLRAIADEVGLVQAHWLRSLFFLILVTVFLRPQLRWPAAGQPPLPLQLVRALLPVAASLALLGAMAYIPVAEATALILVGPTLVALVGPVLLGEKLAGSRFAAALLGLAGMALVVRPGFSTFAFGHLLAICGALLFALYQLATRRISVATDPRLSLFVLAAVALLVTKPFVALSWRPLGVSDLSGTFGAALLYLAGQGLLLYGYARAEASLLAPTTYLLLVGAAIAGVVLFQQVPDIVALAGCAVIILASLLPVMLSTLRGRGNRAR
jgi:drug/metabolite transporter (DMT)-like permease